MAEPAIYIFMRNGEMEAYRDPWGGLFLFRELCWGPREFYRWARQLERADRTEHDVDAGALVDFDKQTLSWHASYDAFLLPRCAEMHAQMVGEAWPDFQIDFFTPTEWRSLSGGNDHTSQDTQNQVVLKDVLLDAETRRMMKVSSPMDETRTYVAWISIEGQDQTSQHLLTWKITDDLIRPNPRTLAIVKQSVKSEPPPEWLVHEGVSISLSRRVMTFWGSRELKHHVEQQNEGVTDWHFDWDDRGYAGQCERNHVEPKPMNQEALLARFLPFILASKRFDEVGYYLAMRQRMGLRINQIFFGLSVFLGIPLAGLGLTTDQWTPLVVLSLGLLFGWLLARRLSRKRTPELQTTSELENAPPTAAGPREFIERRTRLSELLEKIGLAWNPETEAAMESSQWMRLAVEGPLESDTDLPTEGTSASGQTIFHESSDPKRRSPEQRNVAP